ncbi:hypothetical protein McanCB49686_002719 [Microsporum canis]
MRSGARPCSYEANSFLPPQQHDTHRQVNEFGVTEAATARSTGSSYIRQPTTLSHPPSLTDGSTDGSTFESPPLTYNAKSDSTKTGSREDQSYKSKPDRGQYLISILTPDIYTTSSRIGGTFYIHREPSLSDESTAIPRSITHKARSFGQSHWINMISLFEDTCEIVEPYLRSETSATFSNIEKCKALAKAIKLQRAPTECSTPSANIPSKTLSDELVDCYLKTTESIYRILHIPSFRREYEALFLPETEPRFNVAFLVQVKLVLAIGAVTYDERFSLRVAAIRWVYEAQAWFSEPKFKSRIDIQSLQSHILLLFAQEMVGIGGDPMWVSAGAIVRKAIYMGLHRDPENTPTTTTFLAEMRRRIWNTILEICLQSSLTSGGPPLFSLDDFDTKSPGNFDDEQLEDAAQEHKDIYT